MEEAEKESSEYGKGYGKKPLWQLVLIYLVIGGIIYGLIYYFVIVKKGGYSYNQQTQPTVQQTISPAATQSNTVSSNNVYMTKSDAAKGNYMTDLKGMTLYVFDKDTAGVSNCYNGCAQAWPPYGSGAITQSQLPTNITLIKRTDGSNQFAWKGKPLYYYANDQKAGDITGDGVGGIWHLVNLQ